MDDTILRELGGGAVGVLVVLMLSGYGVLALVIRALWGRIIVLQEKVFDTQSVSAKEVRDLQTATNTALASVTTSLTSLAAVLTERRDRDK